MVRTKTWVAALATLLVMAGLGAGPAAADPPATVVAAGVDTGILISECARTGTGPTGQQASWARVPETYEAATDDPTALGCAQQLLAAAKAHARSTSLDGSVGQQMRSQLFSGRADLTDPYQVFLNNLYLSVPVLESLSDTPDGSATGLGSCNVRGTFLVIDCIDDGGGSFLARDQNGNPYCDWLGNNCLYISLNGLMSQQGGTMYGSVFLQNEDEHPTGVRTLDDWRVEHHEQVHAQQWSQHGWGFAEQYVNQWWNSEGNGNYYYWLYGRVDGIKVPGKCFIAFERQAGFQDGGYAFRDVAHGGPGVGDPLHIPSNRSYPLGWTDQLNAQHGNKCPARWT